MAIRVLVVTNILSPYRVPLFKHLARSTALDVSVIALAESEANRHWRGAGNVQEFGYRVLVGWHVFLRRLEMPIHLNWGLLRALWRVRPDVVMTSGYDQLAYWEAFLYAKLARKPYLLWNGTTSLSTGTVGGPIGWLKRRIVRGADGYVAYGSQAAEYLVAFGAPRERIHVGVNTVDMAFYRERTTAERRAPSFRAKRVLYPEVLLLYVGQLIERKGVLQLLEALRKLDDPSVGLVVVGGGPQESALRRFCKEANLRNVYFEGFHQPEELPEYYALADLLVVPSREEVWGLVVNEALAGGLYVLCSDRAGAAYDVIEDGWNGRLFSPSDVDRLAEIINETRRQLEEIRVRREEISERACREFGIERSAKAFLDAIQAVSS